MAPGAPGYYSPAFPSNSLSPHSICPCACPWPSLCVQAFEAKPPLPHVPISPFPAALKTPASSPSLHLISPILLLTFSTAHHLTSHLQSTFDCLSSPLEFNLWEHRNFTPASGKNGLFHGSTGLCWVILSWFGSCHTSLTSNGRKWGSKGPSNLAKFSQLT